MFRNALWITLLGLIVSGCASDGKMESSSSESSTSGGGAAVSSPTSSGGGAVESSSMNQSSSSKSRIAAGVEEETLDTCLARIPQDATAGQKMMAEHTCRRDYAGRR
jgi:outer membrane murein-binding lipoprotein Lpp